MRSADHDATRVGHRLGSWRLEESHRPLVHGRPNGISPQTEQQLENLLIGLCGNQALRPWCKSLATPGARAPVFIVDEDATIGHTRRMRHREIVAECQPVFLLGYQIAPPNPRRDTCQARELQNAIGSTSGIMTLDNDLSTFYIYIEAIVRPLALQNHDRRFTSGYRCHTRHLSHIVLPHLKSRRHHGLHLFWNAIGNGGCTIEPYFGRHNKRGQCQ